MLVLVKVREHIKELRISMLIYHQLSAQLTHTSQHAGLHLPNPARLHLHFHTTMSGPSCKGRAAAVKKQARLALHHLAAVNLPEVWNNNNNPSRLCLSHVAIHPAPHEEAES